MIFNIQRFCVNDGPGIRTTVFVKGCPLHCIWCHNPESQSSKKELSLDNEKCTLCGKCVSRCPNGCHTVNESGHIIDREKCTLCGECLKTWCGNLEIIGKDTTPDEIIETVCRDKPFYEKSGGGMTVSGGEPMYNFGFTLELLRKAKERGLHICMETSGAGSPENFEKAAEYTDIFLYDYKETDPALHKKYTGADNSLILSNLHRLDEMGARTILRCPIIPTLNDRDDHLEGIADTAESLKNIIEINIEPYHPLGVKKSISIGRKSAYDSTDFPEKEQIDYWIEKIASRTGVPVKRA